jgi:hypothetical protein
MRVELEANQGQRAAKGRDRILAGRARRTRVLTAIATAALLTVTVLVFISLRDESIEADARSAREALEQGDADRLFDFIWDEEIQRLGLTRDKVRQSLDRILLPRLRRYERTSVVTEQVYGRGAQAVSVREYRDGKGHSLDVGSYALLSPAGGKILFSDLIKTAWGLEYFVPSGASWGRVAQYEMILQGIAEDKEELSRIGIPGLIAWPPHDRLLTWSEMEEVYRRRLADARRATSGGSQR